MTRRVRLVVGALVALVAIFVCEKAYRSYVASRQRQDLAAARTALDEERYADVVAATERILSRDPEHIEAKLLTGEAELQRGRVTAAERAFESALAQGQFIPLAHGRLALILSAEGRRWESRPHLMALAQQGSATPEQLFLLVDLSRDVDDAEAVRRFLAAEPDDPLPLIATARSAARQNDLTRAEKLLRQVLAKYPAEPEALAWLGWVLLESKQDRPLLEWHGRLPPELDGHPLVWHVRGNWAKDHGQPREAVRAYAEMLRRDPDSSAANFQMAVLLAGLGQEKQAAVFRQRTQWQQELAVLGVKLFAVRHNAAVLQREVGLLRQTAQLLERLGRTWEARAWYDLVTKLDPAATWAHVERNRLIDQLADRQPTLVPDTAFLDELAWNDFPLPRLGESAADSRPEPNEPSDRPRIRFADESDAAGLHFHYRNSHQPNEEGLTIADSMGGGVGAVDYDGDAWPDLYFTQGAEIAPGFGRDATPRNATDDAARRDRLFRNLGDGQFVDVTSAAGLGDENFSFGVGVGDFDGDGFADLYVANLGRNRLYRNNGDGTFADVTEASQIGPETWTTSCAVVDVNDDGHPDLVDATYALSHDLLSRKCPSLEGRPRSCPPTAFAAAEDRLWINLGDGRFAERSAAAGMQAPRGYGLGIVAADFDGSGRLSLFVANDDTPNFLFVNRGNADDGTPRFDEQGVTSGLGLDRDGKAQACMGVAADDVDGDGRIDLFVTNYYRQSNTLYLHDATGFSDETPAAGLRTPSFDMLGFGAQFLDADLDGKSDLIVTNGHVDDYSYRGEPYRMPAQVFRNQGNARFAEVSAAELGEFFTQQHLGRGLARVDWNRDGRPDAVVSHLDSPAALLTNRTATAAHYLALSLRGVRCARDAIGARVTAEIGGRDVVKQLVAGDGYQASNERKLIIGLGDDTQVANLRIRWPAGDEQTFADVAADVEWLAVEGRAELFRVPR